MTEEPDKIDLDYVNQFCKMQDRLVEHCRHVAKVWSDTWGHKYDARDIFDLTIDEDGIYLRDTGYVIPFEYISMTDLEIYTSIEKAKAEIAEREREKRKADEAIKLESLYRQYEYARKKLSEHEKYKDRL